MIILNTTQPVEARELSRLLCEAFTHIQVDGFQPVEFKAGFDGRSKSRIVGLFGYQGFNEGTVMYVSDPMGDIRDKEACLRDQFGIQPDFSKQRKFYSTLDRLCREGGFQADSLLDFMLNIVPPVNLTQLPTDVPKQILGVTAAYLATHSDRIAKTAIMTIDGDRYLLQPVHST